MWNWQKLQWCDFETYQHELLTIIRTHKHVQIVLQASRDTENSQPSMKSLTGHEIIGCYVYLFLFLDSDSHL